MVPLISTVAAHARGSIAVGFHLSCVGVRSEEGMSVKRLCSCQFVGELLSHGFHIMARRGRAPVLAQPTEPAKAASRRFQCLLDPARRDYRRLSVEAIDYKVVKHDAMPGAPLFQSFGSQGASYRHRGTYASSRSFSIRCDSFRLMSRVVWSIRTIAAFTRCHSTSSSVVFVVPILQW